MPGARCLAYFAPQSLPGELRGGRHNVCCVVSADDLYGPLGFSDSCPFGEI